MSEHEHAPGSPSLPALSTQGLTPRVVLTITILIPLCYLAFCLSGFRIITEVDAQPLPIYIFFAALLLTLQYTISTSRSMSHRISLLVTGGFSLLYIGVFFFTGKYDQIFNIFTSRETLLFVNLIIYIVFVIDTINRRRESQAVHRASASVPGSARAMRIPTLEGYIANASDLGGFTLLAFFLNVCLRVIHDPQTYVVGFFQPFLSNPLVKSIYEPSFPDFNPEQWHLVGRDVTVPFGSFPSLPDINIDIAYGSGFLATVLVVIIIGLVVVKNGLDIFRTLREMGNILREALREVIVSLRRSLTAIIWIVPALMIAVFSALLNGRFRAAYDSPSHKAGDLFALTGDGLLDVFLAIGIGVLAILLVIAAVAVAEFDFDIVQHTIMILGNTGQIVLLGAPLIIYGLGLLNAFFLNLGLTSNTPFKIGAAGPVTVLLAILVPVITTFYIRFLRRSIVQTSGKTAEKSRMSIPIPFRGQSSRPTKKVE